MGSEAVVQAAEQYGKNFLCSEKIDAVDLQDLCYKVINCKIKHLLDYLFVMKKQIKLTVSGSYTVE